MRIWVIRTVVAALLLVGAFLGYQKFIAQPAAKKTETATVKRGNLQETMTISGKIDADEHVTLRFQTSGQLAWVGVKEGDYVKKYQGIAALDQREVRANLNKYLQTYMKTRWDFENSKDTSGDPAAMTTAVRRALEKAQFDLNSSVLDVELKDLAIKLANMWSPIEGLVTRVESPFAGVNITPTQAEVEIVNPNTVFFSALADQTEVTKLSASMPGSLKLDSFTDKDFPGHIAKISFTPDTGETGTVYDVKFAFDQDNSNYQYRLGMTGDLTFILNEKKDVLYLPNKFLKSEAGKRYVNVFANDKKIKTFVQTGLETDDATEIASGLTEGQKILE